jgi:hypothetical protein
MTVQTDLERLRKRLNLPPGNFPCRWVTAPVGAGGGSGLPGPTDTRTYAFVALDGPAWNQVVPVGGREARATVELDAAVARAILPAAALAGAREEKGRITIEGSAVPGQPLGRSPYRASHAIRMPDGLLVGLFTM